MLFSLNHGEHVSIKINGDKDELRGIHIRCIKNKLTIREYGDIIYKPKSKEYNPKKNKD